jgi:CRISPR-associated protein Csc3
LTRPFIEGLQSTIRRIITEDTAVQALNLNVQQSVEQYLNQKMVTPTFRSRTKNNKPQPYGLYLPRYSETVGNLPIFPLNPGGNNDTERFLFALWNALLLQRHFGLKVLLSNAAVPPLDADHTPDVYVDNIPLGCQGLLHRNDYAEYQSNSDRGPLEDLWADVGHLFRLRSLTSTVEDKTAYLVRALLGSPLKIFYETERLLEARVRGPDQGGLLTWLFQQAFSHVEALSLNSIRGGIFMTQLSNELRQLAELAWHSGLRGGSLKKSSLLFPVNEVFQKLRLLTETVDRDAAKAAAAQDIFDHIERIADDRYKPGRKKQEAIKQFVDGWFDNVLEKIYNGNQRKLLSDEKLIRSAYHFYIREQIPRKEVEEVE